MTTDNGPSPDHPASTLEVDHLRVTLPTADGPRLVIDDVSLHLGRGESMGLVGESGSGKSVSARAILRVLGREAKVEGRVRFDHADVYKMSRKQLRAWRAADVALIHQDPRSHINPLHSIGDFLTEALCSSGMKPDEADRRAVSLLRRVGIRNPEQRMRQYPYQLSGGLLQRVMIAASLLTDPRLLIADEPTTALDVTTQEGVVALLDDLRRQEQQLSLIFITHDLDLAAAITDRIAVMYAGRIVESGPTESLVDAPMHPYTSGLLNSRPSATAKLPLAPIPGRPAAADEVQGRCGFAARCAFATDICWAEPPDLRTIGAREVACHHALELRGSLTPAATA